MHSSDSSIIAESTTLSPGKSAFRLLAGFIFAAYLSGGSGLLYAADLRIFQEGFTNYSGTHDTTLRSVYSRPGDEEGNTEVRKGRIGVDTGLGAEVQGLIRFDGVFGGQPGQVPYGAYVLRATLEVNVINRGNLPDLYEICPGVSCPWEETDLLYTNAQFNGNSEEGMQVYPEEKAFPEAFPLDPLNVGDRGVKPGSSSEGLGHQRIDITDVAQGWARGRPNNGLLFLATGSDAWVFSSSEAASRDPDNGPASNHPKLEVEFLKKPHLSIYDIDIRKVQGDVVASITWSSLPGGNYTLYMAPSLEGPWSTFGTRIDAESYISVQERVLADADQMYFRVGDGVAVP